MKSHTFRVTCSFEIQYSFTEAEVTAVPDGSDEDIEPTEPALAQLQAELETVLGENFAITSLSVESDSDDLIGTANN